MKKVRLLVEVDDDVVFSTFNYDGETGGIKTLDTELQQIVKEQLETALLQFNKD